MSQGEWVLLPGLLGLMGLLSFASRVDSASLSGTNLANEIPWSRVCADLCDADLPGKPCHVFCASRRQFRIQSNTVVGERDVDEVGDTRPTLCQHGFGGPNRNCVGPQASDPEVSWENICDIFCGDKNRPSGCPECLKTYPARGEETMQNIGPGRIPRSPRNAGDASTPRGVLATSDVTGEHLELIVRDVEPPKTSEGVATKADGINVDWEEFCKIECARGNGGPACNCDIIP